MSIDVRQLKQVLAEAIAKDLPAERGAYLAQACGADAELREEVERLLKAHEQAGDFLEIPVVPPGEEPIGEGPGAIIGRYRLLGEIGEGGFGRVFMAEQQAPVHRKVALKIIKAGMDTRQVVARFEAERQALALMDHPNIARVLDAGATESGRPYFVMEVVNGIPITEYCDRFRLPIEERLPLFMKVCAAVQHAHQKGIIHRDLKPTNILVMRIDGQAVPKVIDFGVAKALGPKLTEKTLFTTLRQMVGTPAYMSPEQAELSGVDADTRSDIYSLGVLLYELLTGTTPLDRETLSQVAQEELRRMICEAEPAKPSTRLWALGQGLTEVAGHRRTEPAALAHLVRGDLDWIVMKCLEKDRARRYDTPTALAHDLQNYLQHQPVQAHHPSTFYRVRKLLRRNRALAGLVAAIGLALAVGLGAALKEFNEARRERDRALAAERTAEKRRADAEHERLKAGTFANVLWRMLAVRTPPGKGYTVEAMLDDFCARYTNKPAWSLPEAEADVEQMIGAMYYDLGSSKARPHYERALALRRQVYGAHHLNVAGGLWMLALQCGPEEGERLATEGIGICRESGPQSFELAGLLSTRASYRKSMGRLEAARQDLEEALAIGEKLTERKLEALVGVYAQLGFLACDQTNWDEGVVWLRRARDASLNRPGPPDGWTASTTWMLGRALQHTGQYAQAELYLREGLATCRWMYGDESRSARDPLSHLRLLLQEQGKTDPEIDRLWYSPTRQIMDSTSLPSVIYRLRIQTPGDYRLWLRWCRCDAQNDALYAQIPELNDGPGGLVADAWCFFARSPEGNAKRASQPAWSGLARFEGVEDLEPLVPAVWKNLKPADYTLRIVTGKAGAALDAVVLQLTSLPDPENASPAESESAGERIFLQRDGRVVVEAEHFAVRVNGNEIRWAVVPAEGQADELHLRYRGPGYLKAVSGKSLPPETAQPR